jgi:hypothetical protein
MWDEHVNASTKVSVLNAPGVTKTSCTILCTQTYSCNGTALSSFYIKYSFSRGTNASGVAVTNVTATKSPE